MGYAIAREEREFGMWIPESWKYNNTRYLRLRRNADMQLAAAKMRIVRERAKRAERKMMRWLRKEIEG